MALVMVTGASSGLGRLIAESLADAGHDVVLHLRSTDRLTDRDLFDPGQVRAVAEQAGALGHLDAVIHNAGVMSGRDVMAVNAVAPYLLTAHMPLPGRIIVTSSSMHRDGDVGIDAEDFELSSYSTSKLCVTAFAMALAGSHAGTLVHAVDPGWVPTRMGGPGAPDDLTAGHRTQEWLATAPETDIRPRTGGYWRHRRAGAPHPAALDPGFQGRLIGILEQRTGTTL
ncbi:SDR family NAD(P)-dependent oxidoreductase [Propionibacterium australiense]|uniref:Short chain dehydrogenase n=1 Tax=Propionibacterium australiense TaxID=119981 RepID=A0A383SBP1_9ACTN|nr:SDR family NAD(P)-dependent oxidoreductase [Propionibacterium australiense]SYZ34646.1 short chain dehydrogenase [Propionibacterium australiense]VEH91743.1 3-oxoacyl-[acyl-carrier-protein] reductase FabG [Propionibacterium australiense]